MKRLIGECTKIVPKELGTTGLEKWSIRNYARDENLIILLTDKYATRCRKWCNGYHPESVKENDS